MLIKTAAPLLVAAVAIAWPRLAAAQACCAATALVSPVRLQAMEQAGMGVRLRGRDIFGSFAGTGDYQSASAGDVDMAQDLFAAARIGVNGQVALLLPIVQTRRAISGLSSWGGGIGDLAISGRYTLLLPGEKAYLPGFSLQIGLSIPTGRPVADARDTLATDATGTGTFEGTVGFDVQQISGPWFVGFDGWLAKRVPGTGQIARQSLPLSLTAVLSGGYVFRSQASAGVFLTGQRQAESHDLTDGKPIVESALTLTTAGAGAIIPVDERWRLQTTVSIDIPLSDWGRNQLAGVGLTVSLCRLWL